LGSIKLLPFGQGSGMLGLPGDFTPPSRFVRAVAFSQSVFKPKTGNDAVLEAFHILNQFDIPKGAAREHEKDEHGNILADYTIWTAASDLKAKKYYFRTYENSQIRMVDLMKMNLDGKDMVKISMNGEGSHEMPMASNDAGPVHRVRVDGFWMDVTAVTNEQFEKFVKATSYVTIAERTPTNEEFPTAPAENLVAGSVVFAPPDHEVP